MHAELANQLARPFDLIVVGAGINGTGIARDAALRGLRVVLLTEKRMSRRSSRMRRMRTDFPAPEGPEITKRVLILS